VRKSSGATRKHSAREGSLDFPVTSVSSARGVASSGRAQWLSLEKKFTGHPEVLAASIRLLQVRLTPRKDFPQAARRHDKAATPGLDFLEVDKVLLGKGIMVSGASPGDLGASVSESVLSSIDGRWGAFPSAFAANVSAFNATRDSPDDQDFTNGGCAFVLEGMASGRATVTGRVKKVVGAKPRAVGGGSAESMSVGARQADASQDRESAADNASVMTQSLRAVIVDLEFPTSACDEPSSSLELWPLLLGRRPANTNHQSSTGVQEDPEELQDVVDGIKERGYAGASFSEILELLDSPQTRQEAWDTVLGLVARGHLIKVFGYSHWRFVHPSKSQVWLTRPYSIRDANSGDSGDPTDQEWTSAVRQEKEVKVVFDSTRAVLSTPWVSMNGSPLESIRRPLRRGVVALVVSTPGLAFADLYNSVELPPLLTPALTAYLVMELAVDQLLEIRVLPRVSTDASLFDDPFAVPGSSVQAPPRIEVFPSQEPSQLLQALLDVCNPQESVEPPRVLAVFPRSDCITRLLLMHESASVEPPGPLASSTQVQEQEELDEEEE